MGDPAIHRATFAAVSDRMPWPCSSSEHALVSRGGTFLRSDSRRRNA